MKNIILTFSIIFSFTLNTQLSAQDASNESWSLIHERFATWCPLCGTWGWTLKERILDEFENDNVIFISEDYSGDLANNVSQKFDSNFGGNGQPLFFFDGSNSFANANNSDQIIQDFRAQVDFKRDFPPYAGVGLNAIYYEDTQSITVDAKVEYFQEVESGEFYMGLYLLENVWAPQQSRPGIPEHKNVLQASFLPEVFDNYIANGPVTKGRTFQFNGTLYGLTATPSNYKVVGIIWAKNGQKYLFHNAFITDVRVSSSTYDDVTSNSVLTTYQSESGSIIVSLDNNITLEPSAGILISDISGKTLKTVNFKNDGQRTVTIDMPYSPGIHIVTLRNGKQQITKKIVLM